MASGPDQSDELSMLDGDDRIVTPDSAQNFNGFGTWIMYKHTFRKCRTVVFILFL